MRSVNVKTDTQINLTRILQSSIDNFSVWILILFPGILTSINHNWLFLNVWSFTDTWIYFGYFNNLPQLQHIYQSFDKVYFGDRLSWVLPGYILYQILPPIIANSLLHLGIYYTAVFSLYRTLLLSVGQRGALLAALLFSGYSYFILSAGTDYVEGAGIAYFLLAIVALTQAASGKRTRIWLIVCGAATAAVVYVNLFWIVFLPYILAYYLFLYWPNWHTRLRSDVLWLASGFTGVTAVLGLASFIISGNPFFYGHSLSFANNLFRSPKNAYIPYNADWFLHSPHILWPFITVVACAVALSVKRIRVQLTDNKGALFFLVAYIFAAFEMLLFQLRGSTPVLVVYYYTGYLQPAMFLAMGVLLHLIFAPLRQKYFIYLTIFTSIALTLAFALRACYGNSAQMQFTIATIVISLLLIPFALNKLLRVWAYASLVVTFCFVTPSAFAANYSQGILCELKSQPDFAGNYLAVRQAIQTIQSVAPNTRIYFWYDFEESHSYRAMAAAYLHSWNITSEEFPALKPMGAESEISPSSETVIALLSKDVNAVAVAQKSLARYQRTADVLTQKSIKEGEFDTVLTVMKVRDIPLAVTVGTQLDFSVRGNPKQFLRDGWYAPEGFGSWTMGPQSSIDVSTASLPSTDLTMTFDIVAAVGSFVQQRPKMTVDVFVNDVHLGQWILEQNIQLGEHSINIPQAVLEKSKTLHVSLQIQQPHSLRELGYNDDERLLGIAVRSLTLSPMPK